MQQVAVRVWRVSLLSVLSAFLRYCSKSQGEWMQGRDRDQLCFWSNYYDTSRVGKGESTF